MNESHEEEEEVERVFRHSCSCCHTSVVHSWTYESVQSSLSVLCRRKTRHIFTSIAEHAGADFQVCRILLHKTLLPCTSAQNAFMLKCLRELSLSAAAVAFHNQNSTCWTLASA